MRVSHLTEQQREIQSLRAPTDKTGRVLYNAKGGIPVVRKLTRAESKIKYRAARKQRLAEANHV